jgi:hemerythrin
MAYLDWNRAFDTGIPGIDFEHRRLVDMLNNIHRLTQKDAEPQHIATLWPTSMLWPRLILLSKRRSCGT